MHASVTLLLRRSAACAVSLAAALALMAGQAAYADIDRHTSYIANNQDAPVVVPDAPSYWAAAMDRPEGELLTDGGAVASAGDKLFFVQDGRLIAVESKSGKRLWSFGTGMQAPVVYADGRVYAVATGGILCAADAQTGKKLWQSNMPSKGASELYVQGDKLYALNGDIQAYRVADGVLEWRDDYEQPLPGPLLLAGNRIFAANIESGAYSYEVLHAFDSDTGKQAWSKMNKSFPIAVDGNAITVQRQQTIIDKGMLTTLDTLDIDTGKALGTVEYNPENVNLDRMEFYSPGIAWIGGDSVYIAIGTKVYAYPKDKEPDNADMATYLSPAAGDVRYAAGPYDGRLIFSDGEKVVGVKLGSGGPIFYNGGLSNPVARLDLIGNGMYVAQSDGRVVAIDLTSAKPVSQLHTYARVFGPTFEADGMIVVQTMGKLLAFPEPSGLRGQAVS